MSGDSLQRFLSQTEDFYVARRYDMALEQATRACAIDPNNALANLGVGMALARLRRPGALVYIERALAGNPRDARLPSGAAEAYFEYGRFPQALAQADRAIALEPTASRHHQLRGVVLMDLKQYNEARVSLEKAIALSPQDAGAHLNLARTLKVLNRWDEHEEHLRRALAIRPNEPSIQFSLGCTLRSRGKYAEAEEAFRAALRSNPAYEQAQDGLLSVAFRNHLALGGGYRLMLAVNRPGRRGVLWGLAGAGLVAEVWAIKLQAAPLEAAILVIIIVPIIVFWMSRLAHRVLRRLVRKGTIDLSVPAKGS